MHQTAKHTRQRTDRQTVIKLAIYCSQNVAALSGKKFSEVAGIIRRQFNGEFVADQTIRAALDASSIPYKKREATEYGKRKDRARAMATILLHVTERIASEFGSTIVTDEEREILRSIAYRKDSKNGAAQ